MQILPVGAELFYADVRTDRQKDRQTRRSWQSLSSIFYVSRTVHLSITLANDQLGCTNFLNTFITISCSSSGGQNVLIQHLVLSLSVNDRPVHRLGRNCIILIQFDLLRISNILFETCTVHVEDCNKLVKKFVHQVGHWLRLLTMLRNPPITTG
jgi:hypothetical protein